MAYVDLNIVARLERSMLTSWPALSTAFDGDWVIRLAKGHTKRSNSVTCLGADDAHLETRIDRVVQIFRDRDLPATFRLSPLASPALDRALAKRGWRRFDESIVMTADLANIAHEPRDDDVLITSKPDDAWMEGCHLIDGLSEADAGTFGLMLDHLLPSAGYGRLVTDNGIGALALAVLDVELAGLFVVMTAKERRRQGLARRLLDSLLCWSRMRDATTGWLAVEAGNVPAVRLYERLGFREVYRYHYRSNA
ncbi:MAG: GNAT family N-acetyltransferase [Alphaproteobacteria bacterium]|nr:GNAT family N-acetyltransferase [Alphaproteobacteria bacterium]